MTTSKTDGPATVITMYPDHESAEDAVRRLQKEGIPMQNLWVIGKDFQAVEQPLGFVTTGRSPGKGPGSAPGREASSACCRALR
jgi:hypothetical protein